MTQPWMWTTHGNGNATRPNAALVANPATMLAAMTQAMVKKNRASPRSVSVEYAIVALLNSPSARPVEPIPSPRAKAQRVGSGSPSKRTWTLTLP